MKARVRDAMPQAGVMGNTLVFSLPKDHSSLMVALAVAIVCKRTVVHVDHEHAIIEPYERYTEVIHSLFRRAAKVAGPSIIFLRLQSGGIPAASTLIPAWFAELVRTRPPGSIVIAMTTERLSLHLTAWDTFDDVLNTITGTTTTTRPRDQSRAWMQLFTTISDIAWKYFASKQGVLPPRPVDAREHWNRVAALGVD